MPAAERSSNRAESRCAPSNGDANIEIWVANEHALGAICLSDELRPEAFATIEILRHGGAEIALLTGDRAAVANRIANALGIRDVRAGLSPADKLECVQHWQAEGRSVAMVGDGINDAPSLTAADVALAMGARGSDAALEQADVASCTIVSIGLLMPSRSAAKRGRSFDKIS